MTRSTIVAWSFEFTSLRTKWSSNEDDAEYRILKWGNVSRFPLDSGWAEVIITTENPGTLQRTIILMNRHDVITRLTLAKFSAWLSRRIALLAKNYVLRSLRAQAHKSDARCSTRARFEWQRPQRNVRYVSARCLSNSESCREQVSELLAAECVLSSNQRVPRCVQTASLSLH